jgi:GYF domain 2
MARWLVRSPGAEPHGPVEAAELREKWRRHEISPGTMVCAEGYTHWTPFHVVAELVQQPAPPLTPTPTTPRWLGSLLVAAAVCGVAILVLIGLVGVQWARTPSAPGGTVTFNPCSR